MRTGRPVRWRFEDLRTEVVNKTYGSMLTGGWSSWDKVVVGCWSGRSIGWSRGIVPQALAEEAR